MEQLTFPIRGTKLATVVEVQDWLVRERSDYQLIEIAETEVFGRMLLLDGHIQLTEFDEQAYHEALVHIPLQALPEASSALVIGAGDGGVIRELVRAGISNIEIVEIDEMVIDLCRQHLPSLSNGAFDHPSVRLTVGDAFQFVREQVGRYDLIVADSTDTYEDEEGELSAALFTREFYGDCLGALKPGGVLATQADNPVFCPYSLDSVCASLGEVFPVVEPYFGLVPSFGGYSAFVMASTETRLPSDFSARTPGLGYLNETSYRLARDWPLRNLKQP